MITMTLDTDSSFSGETYHIDLEPVGRRIRIRAGQSLLEAAQGAGVELVAMCGGVGICEGCLVRVASGKFNLPGSEEQAKLTPERLAQGYRLACQTIPQSDCRVDIPPESLTTAQRLQVEGQEMEVDLDPPVVALDVVIEPPTITDLRSDLTRLVDAAKKSAGGQPILATPLLASFSDRLRAQGWKARLALRGVEIVAILPHPEEGNRDNLNLDEQSEQVEFPRFTPHVSRFTLLGVAFDIGSTKLAGYLVNLESGETLARAGAMNPQIGYGEDVVSRILYTNEHADGRQVLQSRLVAALNDLIAGMCAEAGASPEQVVEVVAAGNTAMHHLFAGLPVRQLGASPYVAAASEAMELRAASLGLQVAPGAYVYLPPNIAGYVGADHVAMQLATGLGEADVLKRGNVIALDIGTNTEISLSAEGRILSCSCASGPAFEGAHISEGMRAAPGAIERVQVETKADGGVLFLIHTIENRPAVGICGSGILDAVATLLQVGAIDPKGNMLRDHPLVRVENSKRSVSLIPVEESGNGREVAITRKDVNEIQLAKGAIRSGVEILLEDAGLTYEQIDEFIVAGAFGTYLDLGSAVKVGMFPPLPRERFQQVGNAAGAGARQMLVSLDRRKTAARLAHETEYIELTIHPAFRDVFVRELMFGDE
jgi:uncharacterized 2Fe-2S/4Fe-4S cluster protein (DUF4445 family)